MEKIVEILTILIVYCNPSLCKELWVKWLVYIVRLWMTSQQGFFIFQFGNVKKCKKIDELFQREKN
jgi:hypothetical protein